MNTCYSQIVLTLNPGPPFEEQYKDLIEALSLLEEENPEEIVIYDAIQITALPDSPAYQALQEILRKHYVYKT